MEVVKAAPICFCGDLKHIKLLSSVASDRGLNAFTGLLLFEGVKTGLGKQMADNVSQIYAAAAADNNNRGDVKAPLKASWLSSALTDMT